MLIVSVSVTYWLRQKERGSERAIWRRRDEDGIGRRVVPQEEQDGGCSSLDVTGGHVDQQCRTDFCVPKYARDSFNLTTSSVESGFLVDGSSGASSDEGLALGAVG